MKKKSILSVLGLCFVLPCIFLLSACSSTPSNTTPEEPTEPTKLNAPVATLNVNVVSWSAINNAIGYEIWINQVTNTVTLSITQHTLQDGQSFKVRAIGNNIDYLTSDWSNLVTYTEPTPPPPQPIKLSSPIVSIDENGLATWNAVSNASGYAYKINNGTEQSTSSTTVQLSDGDNIVVKAIGDGTNFSDSDYSQTKSYTAPPAPEPLELTTPVVSIDENGLASWNVIENASGYKYKINNNSEQSTTSNSVQLSDGDNIVVKAVGDGINFSDSDYSETKTYTAPIIPTNVTYTEVVDAIEDKITPLLQATYTNETNTISNVKIKYINYANGMIFFTYTHSSEELLATTTIEELPSAKSYSEIVHKLPTYTVSDFFEKTAMYENETSIVMAQKVITNRLSKFYDTTDVVWAMHSPETSGKVTMFIIYNDGYWTKRTFTINTTNSSGDLINDFAYGTAYDSSYRDIAGGKYIDLKTAFNVDNSSKSKALKLLTENLEKALLKKYETNSSIVVSNLRIDFINKINGMISCKYTSKATRLTTTSFSTKMVTFTVPELITATSYENMVANANNYTYTINDTTFSNYPITDKCTNTMKQKVGDNADIIELYYRTADEIEWAIYDYQWIVALKDGAIIKYDTSSAYTKIYAVSTYMNLDDAFDGKKTIQDVNIKIMDMLNKPVHDYHNIQDDGIMPCVIYNNVYGSCYYTYNGYLHRFSSRYDEVKNMDDLLTLIENTLSNHYVYSVCKYDTSFQMVIKGIKIFAENTYRHKTALQNLGLNDTLFDYDDILFFVAPEFKQLFASNKKKFVAKICIYTKTGLMYAFNLVRGTEDQGETAMDIVSCICYSGIYTKGEEYKTACDNWSVSNSDILTLKDFINNGFSMN